MMQRLPDDRRPTACLALMGVILPTQELPMAWRLAAFLIGLGLVLLILARHTEDD